LFSHAQTSAKVNTSIEVEEDASVVADVKQFMSSLNLLPKPSIVANQRNSEQLTENAKKVSGKRVNKFKVADSKPTKFMKEPKQATQSNKSSSKSVNDAKWNTTKSFATKNKYANASNEEDPLMDDLPATPTNPTGVFAKVQQAQQQKKQQQHTDIRNNKARARGSSQLSNAQLLVSREVSLQPFLPHHDHESVTLRSSMWTHILRFPDNSICFWFLFFSLCLSCFYQNLI
jgi:hypothetical protein